MVDGLYCCDAIFPSEYCCVIPLKKQSSVLVQRTKDIVSAISIIPFETYSASEVYSLNSIQLFDIDGKHITKFKLFLEGKPDTKKFTTPVSYLFEDKKNKGSHHDIFSENLNDTHILIVFDEPQNIGAIVLSNIVNLENTRCISVKKVRIEINGKLAWVGRLKTHTLDDPQYDFNTYVFFNDDTVLHEKIKKEVFTPIKEEIDDVYQRFDKKLLCNNFFSMDWKYNWTPCSII